MMYLAVAVNARDTNIIPDIVSFLTRSGAYHCELVFSDDNACVVTPKYIGYMRRTYEWYKWQMLPLPMINAVAEADIRTRCNEIFSRNPTYDWLGVILGALFRNLQTTRKWYCSELCKVLLNPYIPGVKKHEGWITPDRLCRIVSDELANKYPDYTTRPFVK